MEEIKVVPGFDKVNVRDLSQLWKSVGWSGENSSIRYPNRLLESLKKSDTLLTVWDGERLVGLLSAVTDSLNVFISYLLVDSDYQKHGVGAALMHTFLAEHLNDRIFVFTETAQDFYEKFGFKAEGTSMVSLPLI